MRLINIFFLFLLAPFIGIGIFLYGFPEAASTTSLAVDEVNRKVDYLQANLFDLQKDIVDLSDYISDQEEEYQEQVEILQRMAESSQQKKQESDQIYEERILKMLGPPIKTYYSDRVEIKIFGLDELGYRGYIAKLKLFDPEVFKVVLAGDSLGEKETTLSAVQRSGAILGINGGGFYSQIDNGQKLDLPLGNTIIDGELVNGFHMSDELFFAGIQKDGNLVGGTFSDEDKLLSLNAQEGVSFLPILIQAGKPLPLPNEWKRTRHPRTIIGEYANGDLIMIVVDGRQQEWSSGVTLERLQIKLIELGVKDGYNLDGGGSTTMVYDGEILNRPSDGKPRPVVTNIVIMP